MEEVYILKNGLVVRANDWDLNSIRVSRTTGYLLGFKKNVVDTYYIHVNKTSFRNEDDNFLLSSGYYPRDDFFNYLVDSNISASSLRQNKYEFDVNAIDGDFINVEILDSILDDGNLFPHKKSTNLLMIVRNIMEIQVLEYL